MLRVNPLYQELWNEKVSLALGLALIATMVALAIDLVTLNNRMLVFAVLIPVSFWAVVLFDTYLRMKTGQYQRRAYERREFDKWLKRKGYVTAPGISIS